MLERAVETLSVGLSLPDSACAANHSRLPRRTAMLYRVAPPPGMPLEKFHILMSRGGIHPRGVVLHRPISELPLQFNAAALRVEMEQIIKNAGMLVHSY